MKKDKHGLVRSNQRTPKHLQSGDDVIEEWFEIAKRPNGNLIQHCKKKRVGSILRSYAGRYSEDNLKIILKKDAQRREK